MQIKCSHCGQTLTVPDGTDAAQGKCSGCGRMVDIQAAERLSVGPGDTLGNFRIDSLIGRGGMATVYRATQLSLDRPVAIKVLHRQLAKRKRFVGRFEREGKLLAQLSHPNIVGIVAVGATDDGTYYLAMDYVEGETLRDRLKREGRLPFEEAARMVDAVAAGLEHAHEQGVLHRDIKPDNVLIGSDGVPKVVDFGIARMTGAETLAQQRLTVAKTLMGSAHYMAPEQMEDAAAVDHRADVYALGVLFYELLTGKLPIGQFEPASTVADGVPIPADRLIRHALAANPEQRVQTVAQFRTFLQRMLAPGAPPRSHVHLRRRTRKTSAPLALILLGAVAAIVIAVAALSGGKKDEQAVVAEPKEKSRPEPAVVAPPPKKQPPPVRTKASPPPEKKAEPEVRVEPPEPAVGGTDTGPLHCTVRRFPGGRVELQYDWSSPEQLEDWRLTAGREPRTDGGVLWLVSSGTGRMVNRAVFAGDIDVRGTWQVKKIYWRSGFTAVGICMSDGGGYDFEFRDGVQNISRYKKRPALSKTNHPCPRGGTDAFRFIRTGPTLRAWVNGLPLPEASDAEWSRGQVHLGCWKLSVRVGELRIIGRPDPEWLAADPEVKQPIDASPLAEEEAPEPVAKTEDDALPPEPPDKTPVPAPAPPKPSVGKPGKWITLFDGRSLGKWEALKSVPDGGKLGVVKLVKGAMAFDTMGTCALIKYTGDLPETNYEVTFSAMLVDGEKIGAFVFPVGKVHATWAVQGYKGIYTGLAAFDGRDYRSNCTTRRLSLAKGNWHAVRLRVTPTSIEGWVGAEQTLAYLRDQKRLSSAEFARALGSLGHYTNNSRVVLRNIRIRTLPEGSGPECPLADPAKAPVGSWVSLFDGTSLRGWEPASTCRGSTGIVNGSLDLHKRMGKWTSAYWMGSFPKFNYEMSLEVKPGTPPGDFLKILFPMRDHRSEFSMCRKCFGIIDRPHKKGYDNRTRRAAKFSGDRWYPVLLRVDDEAVTVSINGKEAIREAIEGYPFDESKPSGLVLSTRDAGGFVRNIRIRRLSD